MNKDIKTKNKKEFLKKEFPFFHWKKFENFKKEMEEDAITCNNCGIYFWKGCRKRCECTDGDLIESFRNNIFCRRESNQNKAKKIWEEIKYQIPEKDRMLFSTEWSHYLMGELAPNDFSRFFEEYIKSNF